MRAIAGVPTSVAAFIGRTTMEPVNQPVRVQNFSAFERAFGGMNAAFALPYSVQQYFQNGGADAYVVRLEKGATAAQIHVPVGVTTQQPINAGATTPQTVQAQDEKIAGRTVITDPPKALKENTTLFIAPGQQAFSQDYTYVGPAVIVGDEGIPFEKAVTLEMPIAVENIPDGKKITDVKFLVWSHKNGTLSLQAQASSDPDKKKASLATKTFSTVQPVIEAASAKPPKADPAPMVLSAKNGGAWGNGLQVIIDYNTRNPADATLFNLTVQLVDPSTQGVVASETFLNLSSDASAPSYVVRTLNDDSQFVQVEGVVTERPVATSRRKRSLIFRRMQARLRMSCARSMTILNSFRSKAWLRSARWRRLWGRRIRSIKRGATAMLWMRRRSTATWKIKPGCTPLRTPTFSIF
ncbi:hypothetical protein [Varunaivibrio sulfuroxidans]|uniref:hypothetical protein n=1 Tax=Varunaivibrio sulfuroxidans TaxID=1773489 RepID=UPI00140520B3|nr:hypothetical protein [Varunaivibrio sulfuroxidans]WES31576.1 hypothetical protein P3M64_04180 [Varunaivibrio sulfuroxidans]